MKKTGKERIQAKTNRGTENIKCPFFRFHDNVTVGCEGVTEKSSIRQTFTSRRAREEQEQIFCKGKFENCEIYRAIMGAKYDE